jgi:GGDEF domain-containing protein
MCGLSDYEAEQTGTVQNGLPCIEPPKAQATTDPLTGMHNRRYFEEALKRYLREFNKLALCLAC